MSDVPGQQHLFTDPAEATLPEGQAAAVGDDDAESVLAPVPGTDTVTSYAVEGGWLGQATYSPDRAHRYSLVRVWGRHPSAGGRLAGFCLLNPSTATETKLDPTLWRCRSFASREGADGFVIVNAFAFRATDPRAMKASPDPVGEHNDAVLLEVARRCSPLIAGWGTHGVFLGRDQAVLELLSGQELYRLGDVTVGGHPRHPLYLRGDTPLARLN